jgi:hypothetical protein
MTLSMHQVSAPVFLQGLTGLSGVLDKAIAHFADKKIDQSAILQFRLYPDMLAFTRQVQVACDFAKGAVGRLAGDDFPVFEDTEASLEDLKARVDKTAAYIKSIVPGSMDGAEDKDISLVRRGETMTFKGADYLLAQALPNFYFHCTTAYAILRHNGVEIGKRDFLGVS